MSSLGGPTDYWLEYGKTSALGLETPHRTQTLAAKTPTPVGVELTGLERDTRYHYRLCAEDSDGGACGGQRRFRTQDVACGDTVTTDVKLTGTLVCPVGGPGTGIVVGADWVDIDLAGHDLLSAVDPQGASGLNGIDNGGGYDDVTVRNGGVGGWQRAIAMTGADRNQLVDVEADATVAGIEIDGGSGAMIRHSRVSTRDVGLFVRGHSGMVADSNEVEAARGPPVLVEADNSVIRRNTVSSVSPSTGIAVTGSGNRISDNRVTGVVGTGIAVSSGADNRVVENDVSEAFFVSASDPASGDGIFIDPLATGTRLRDNFAHANGGDGIDVQSAGTRLRDNRAISNADLGIEAVAGVIDLGGNFASGNGNPLQCVNVFCQ